MEILKRISRLTLQHRRSNARFAFAMTKKTESSKWAGPAAMAGAAIGSAALAAALLYSSRRKEKAEAEAEAKKKSAQPPTETD